MSRNADTSSQSNKSQTDRTNGITRKTGFRAELFTAELTESFTSEMTDLVIRKRKIGFLIGPIIKRCKFSDFTIDDTEYWKLEFFKDSGFSQTLFIKLFGDEDESENRDDFDDLETEEVVDQASPPAFSNIRKQGRFCLINNDTEQLLEECSKFVRGSTTIRSNDFVSNGRAKVFASGEGAIVISEKLSGDQSKRALLIFALAVAYRKALDEAAIKLAECCSKLENEELNVLTEKTSEFYASSLFRFPIVSHNIDIRPLWNQFFSGLSISVYSDELISQLNLLYKIRNKNSDARRMLERDADIKVQQKRDSKFAAFGIFIGIVTVLQLAVDVYGTFFK